LYNSDAELSIGPLCPDSDIDSHEDTKPDD